VQLDKIPPYAKYLSSIGVDAVLGEFLYIIVTIQGHCTKGHICTEQ